MQIHASNTHALLQGAHTVQRSAETAPGSPAAAPVEAEAAVVPRPVPGAKAAADSGEERGGADARPDGDDEAARELSAQVRELAARDREVRAHERAHLSAAGGLARGGMSLEMQRGPDGRQYAVGGEVQVDTSAVAGDPRATIAKASQIRRAALAPAEPSTQDRRVAAQAAAMETAARAELAAQSREVNDDGGAGDSEAVSAAAGTEAGGEPCPMCGGAGHDRGEHVAGNERRLAAGLQAAPEPASSAGLDLQA